MDYLYDKSWYQEAYQAGSLLAEPANNYRIDGNFIVAFGFEKGILGDYRTLVVDAKRGELLLKQSTNSLLTHLVNDDLFGGILLQKAISKILKIKEQHVVSTGGGAIFSLASFHTSGTDLVALQKMEKVECRGKQMMFTELASSNHYLLDPPRSFAQSYKQEGESIMHNAFYTALLHRMNGNLSSEVLGGTASGLLNRPQYQQFVDNYLAREGITLKKLMDQIEDGKRVRIKKRFKDLNLPVQAMDLDYVFEQTDKDGKFRM